jgi:CPA2 family monovalent cation:H+ antiporter-2
VWANWATVLSTFGIVFVGKTLIIFVICVMLRMNPVYALATGITLAQIGEFSFVLATVARNGGLIDDPLFFRAVSITILSMFFAPYMVAYARPAARAVIGLFSVKTALQADGDPKDSRARRGRVLVVGFGPSGRKVADALLKRDITPEVVELNPASIKAAKKMGLTVHLGDASNADVISHVGIEDSCVIVVTVPDPRSARQILQSIHAISPGTSVIIRSRYNIATRELWELGAAFVVDEENVVGQELARQVIEFLKEADPEAVECALPPDEG